MVEVICIVYTYIHVVWYLRGLSSSAGDAIPDYRGVAL